MQQSWQMGLRRCQEFAPSARRGPRTRFTFRWVTAPIVERYVLRAKREICCTAGDKI